MKKGEVIVTRAVTAWNMEERNMALAVDDVGSTSVSP